jgi:hypothetical protein
MQAQTLVAILRAHIAAEKADWLESACEFTGERLLAAFVGAGRRVGSQPIGEGSLAPWSRRTVARVALILSLDERGSPVDEGSYRWIQRAYREGDSREKLAVMCALPWLRDGVRYLELALDCSRTNELELFAALALDNDYPAAHYPEEAYNKLVMKAAFLELDLARIRGLLKRANTDLARMGMEYIDERQSAGRSFPPSLWLAIAPSCPAGAVARMLGELQHSVAQRRLGAAIGLGLCNDARVQSFVEERLAVEADAAVISALRSPSKPHNTDKSP